MPYGSDLKTGVFAVNQNKVRDSGSITDGPSLSWSTLQENGSTSWTRAGNNYHAPISLAPQCSRAWPYSPTYHWELVLVPSGPRLPTKVWSKRLQKYVWARKQIPAYRLVKDKPLKKPKTKKGLDIPPNALNFSSVGVSYFGVRSIVARSPAYQESYGYSGDLWLPFAPYGGSGSFSGINIQDYLSHSISSQADVLVDQVTEAANSKAYSKVKNQSVNLLQAIAERRQTIDLFVSVATRLAKALLSLKAARFARAFRDLFPGGASQLANDWLLLQYGIKPLLSDIDGIAKELAIGETIVRDIQAKVTRKSDLVKVATRVENNSPLSYTDEVWIQTKVTVKFKYTVRAVSTRREVTRLGLENLNSIAWELTPFSFVADWFIPIGEYLNSADAFGSLEIVHAHKTVFVEETVLFKRVFGGNFYSYITPDALSQVVIKKTKCIRTIITDPPTLSFPSFKNPVSTGHILNAIALFVQLRR